MFTGDGDQFCCGEPSKSRKSRTGNARTRTHVSAKNWRARDKGEVDVPCIAVPSLSPGQVGFAIVELGLE